MAAHWEPTAGEEILAEAFAIDELEYGGIAKGNLLGIVG